MLSPLKLIRMAYHQFLHRGNQIVQQSKEAPEKAKEQREASELKATQEQEKAAQAEAASKAEAEQETLKKAEAEQAALKKTRSEQETVKKAQAEKVRISHFCSSLSYGSVRTIVLFCSVVMLAWCLVQEVEVERQKEVKPVPKVEGARAKTHGSWPLFLSQLLLLAAAGGFGAAVFLLPESLWKSAEQV